VVLVNLGAVLADPLLGDGIEALAVGVVLDGARDIATRGPAGAESIYRIASLTKPFTSAALVLALRERGIPLDAPAIELIPPLAPDWRADSTITVGQILGQVSGLRQTVDSAAVAALDDTDDAVLEAARLVVQAGNENEPGQEWAYYNGNYFLAGAVLSAVTGLSYEQAVTQIVLGPWRLARTAFDPPATPITGWDRQSPVEMDRYPRSRRPSGGLWSCITDLLTFAEHLLDDTELLADTRLPRTRPGDSMTYGLGWAVGASGQLYLNGRLPGYRAAILILPDRGYASVGLANQQIALPVIAEILSDLQHLLTGDDLSQEINEFAT
jgi:CubicO group peptidase (beta-lactamase class C family)